MANMVSPGVWIGELDMVLSDVGMIKKSVEVSYHMKAYPYRPFELDHMVGNGINETQGLFESQFDLMRAETVHALGVTLSILNVS